MGDRIEVPLALDDIDVIEVREAEGLLEVRVRSTLRPCCLRCGSVDVVGHGRNERRLRDRPCVGPVVLVWQQRRVRCRDCGSTSRERHPMVQGQRRATERLRRQLFEEALRRPFRDVAADHQVSDWRVLDAFDEHAALELAERAEPNPRVIALDESSYQRSFRYATVLFAPEERRALEMVMGRGREAAAELLDSLDPGAKSGVEVAVIDLHWPFRKAIEKELPNATVVADRFHVQRSVNRAANSVRVRLSRQPVPIGIRTGRRLSRTLAPRFDERAKAARWAFARRAHALSDKDRMVLGELFVAYPQTAVAWAMKEAFAGIYDAPDRAEAERRLETWVANLSAAGLPELKGIWMKLSAWREAILAYHDHRHTNAFAEGMTNKIKVIKRRAYGFRNLARYRAKVLLSCQPRVA